jgi:aspartate-semialdehyde dehydrogenase
MLKVAVVGATGLVGNKMLEVLLERNFPISELIPVASPKSVGSSLEWNNRIWQVVSPEMGLNMQPHLALFSAGGSVSLEWAPRFAGNGTVVIDNSSAWRMDPTIPLVVPEVNGTVIKASHKIIANPNCSTIQLVMVLDVMRHLYPLKRVVLSTYQSVTGTGKKAVDQLMNERAGVKGEMAYAYTIDLNLIPQIDVFLENGYTKEEMKMVNESRKILSLPELPITATAVRVPVLGGHSESVNIEFETEPDLHEIQHALEQTPGVVLLDDPSSQLYPMPLIHAANKDQVFVGRLRKDFSIQNAINCWIVSDNLRKGAATNAVQIAELMLQMGLVKAD